MELANTYCTCGRLHLDWKRRVSGEAFVKLGSVQTMKNTSTRIEKCPHCDWKGLIVPKLRMGCPEHGEWWYKEPEQIILPQPKDDTDDRTKKRNERDARRRRDCTDRKTTRGNYEGRKTVSNTKR